MVGWLVGWLVVSFGERRRARLSSPCWIIHDRAFSVGTSQERQQWDVERTTDQRSGYQRSKFGSAFRIVWLLYKNSLKLDFTKNLLSLHFSDAVVKAFVCHDEAFGFHRKTQRGHSRAGRGEWAGPYRKQGLWGERKAVTEATVRIESATATLCLRVNII